VLGADELLDILPVNWSNTNVLGGRIFGRSDTGTFNNLMGVGGEEFVSHGVADVVREPHHVAKDLVGVRGILSFLSLCINAVPERETEDDADVDRTAIELLEGNIPSKP
jgi:hypothetical protein